jgi:methyl-accepting chemotaxis protein
MKFRSIQFSVAFLAGASVLAVVVALVLYALFANGRTQQVVQENTRGLLQQVLRQHSPKPRSVGCSDSSRRP